MIKVEKLKKSYANFNLDVSLKVKANSIVGLIGQNGSGKSTTFKAILDLINYDSGSIEIFNESAKDLSNLDKSKIGVVLSDSGFSGYLNVVDVKKIVKAMYQNFDHQLFDELIIKYALPVNKQIKEFSSGMKAKLKLIVAISHNPSLLILDEPTAGLDVIARDDILSMLRAYMDSDNEHSILISSHISSDLESLCDDIYMIDQGKIIMHENIDTLLNEFAIIKVSNDDYEQLDKNYVKKILPESYGYKVLVKEKDYYLENFKQLTIEKSSIDEIIYLMIKGESIWKAY